MTDSQPPAPTAKRERKPRSRQRFERKRERILHVAIELINERGTKGMTLLDVARAVNLNTTSVTYYFRRKELLAAAVFEETLGRLEAMVVDAATAPTAQTRVERFLALNVDLRAQVIRGTALQLASLSDLRNLPDDTRLPLEKHYQSVFRRVRGLFGAPKNELHKALLTARAHMLLEVVFWLPVWISQYALVDFPRVQKRLTELLVQGIAPSRARWAPEIIDHVDEAADAESSQANFLRVATRLINEAGYRGASVVRIVEELNVTKGSFYHHLDAKDDLVLECFRRSYRRVACVQTLADDAGGSQWRRISSAIATLLDIQFEAQWPLLRTTALQALPPSLRADVMARCNRMALRFAGMLVDGISEGSLRPVDPLIASQLIMATLNTAYDLRKWASALPRDQAIALYASTLADGLFNDRVVEDMMVEQAEPGIPALPGRNAAAHLR